MLDSVLIRRMCSVFFVTALYCLPVVGEDEPVLHIFERTQLTDVYYSEGVNTGDLNGDGHADVVYGPYWFAGPDFKVKHEIYEPKPQNRNKYANHFFAWVYDFNHDGRPDVLTVGFPGTPAYVYENPGKGGHDKHWKKHEVFDWVSNESPQLVDIVGDERPELVCTRGGYYGYVTIDWDKPFERWTYHIVSPKLAAMRFGHGLGIGDVNGDGRKDIIHAKGWYEQPASLSGDPQWKLHKGNFGSYGGAEMYAYDVNGDGLNDIITSLAAHDFGLAWFEQVRKDGAISFRQHLIMGDRPAQNKFGLVFSELHSVALADMDGDGLKDIVTGKTYYSHHQKSPMWDAGAVVYWFKLTRDKDNNVTYVPYKADGKAGIGRQLIVADVNNDKNLDIVTGGMKGAHVLTHKVKAVDQAEWKAAQPKRLKVDATLIFKPGPKAPIDAKTNRVGGAIEGEALEVVNVTGGKPGKQGMGGFGSDKWSDGAQLFWPAGKKGAKLTVKLPVEDAGEYDLNLVLTRAKDFGIVKVSLDGKTVFKHVDLFHGSDVVTTGVLTKKDVKLAAGDHELTFEIIGANPAAVQKHFIGIDYVQLVK